MLRATPRFILGSVIFLVMLATLITLGTWQLKRLTWKEEVLAKISNSDSNSFIPIEETILHLNKIEDLDFYKVKVRGSFHHDQSISLIPRTWHGVNGAHLYTPLVLSSSGHTLLINRGWIPEIQKNITIFQPEGEVELIGYLQEPSLPGWLTPDNVSHKKAWYYIDLEAIQEEYQKENPKLANKMLPFYMISITNPQMESFPKPLDLSSMIRNNHLGYALTWFSLAIALVFMYILYVRKHLND